MSGTAAIDTSCVGDWGREPLVNGIEGGAGAAHPLAARVAPSGLESAPVPAWPPRKLNDALAELGPARPPKEPWSRARLPKEPRPANTNKGDSPSGGEASEADAAAGRSEGVAPPTADVKSNEIPPPPKPLRHAVVPASSGAAPAESAIGWDDTALADGDLAGAHIVRALAEVNLASHSFEASMRAVGPMIEDDEPLERPPMIIERAIAEQSKGIMAALPVATRGSPLPCLAVGFSLSLMVGAALYLVLASG
jgi:hypothetical protein